MAGQHVRQHDVEPEEAEEALLDRMEPVPEDVLPPSGPRTRPVAVRFDEFTLRRIKVLAAIRAPRWGSRVPEGDC